MKSRYSFSFRQIVLTSAAILLCLTLISTYLTAEMFARYSVKDTASDSARVATFNVTENGELTTSFATELVPGVPCKKEVVVDNKSEVAIAYAITIVNQSKNMDLSFRFGTEGDMDDMTPSGDGFVYTANLEASSGAQNYILEVLWNSKGAEIDLEYMGCVDLVTVTLTSTQID